MEGSIESAGQFATGVAVASVIDPPEARGPGETATCRNCGAPVASAYCANCGQKTHLHRTIGDALHEMVHGVLHFDTKFWRTLPLLATRPGFLTRDYIEGRRVRYISPVALFLLTIFLTYIVFSSISPPAGEDASGIDVSANLTATAENLERARADIRADLAAARAAAAADPSKAGEVARLERMLAGVDTVERSMVGEGGNIGIGPDNIAEVIREAHAEGLITINAPRWLMGAEDKINKALANPELVIYKMQQKGYKLSFLLVPMSLPWLWLLFFWRRDLHGYDHVIFVLYSISFMSMLAITAYLLAAVGVTSGWVFVPLLLIYPLVHLFLQLKGAYGLSTGGALWRTGFLSVAALVTLTLYFVFILLLGLLD
ncbi:MAG: DUF3667 domain-containing protein [Thermaurantiacus sp.]